MKKILQWLGIGIWLGVGILVLIFLSFGAQIYANNTYCKNTISLPDQITRTTNFYSLVQGKCYISIETVSSSVESTRALIEGLPIPQFGHMSASPETMVYEIDDNDLFYMGSRSFAIIKSILNQLGFGPVGYDTSN